MTVFSYNYYVNVVFSDQYHYKNIVLKVYFKKSYCTFYLGSFNFQHVETSILYNLVVFFIYLYSYTNYTAEVSAEEMSIITFRKKKSFRIFINQNTISQCDFDWQVCDVNVRGRRSDEQKQEEDRQQLTPELKRLRLQYSGKHSHWSSHDVLIVARKA